MSPITLSVSIFTRARSTADALAALTEQSRTRAIKMDAIITGMPDGLMVLDPDLKLIEWNAHFPRFAGVPSDLLRVGLDFADILFVLLTYGGWQVAATTRRRIEPQAEAEPVEDGMRSAA